jgi:ABC-type uncharacterized transport system substrate-binding protein
MKFPRRQLRQLAAGAAALSVVAATWPLAAGAQQRGKTWLIGVLETTSADLNIANFSAFLQGLRTFGYVEGKNLSIVYHSADGRDERFPELASDLVHRKVDVIVTRGTPAALAASDATTTIPIVMAAIGDPFMIIKSLARPSGNVTGLSAFTNDLEAKRVELLKRMFPHVVRLAGLYNMENPTHPPPSGKSWRTRRDLLESKRTYLIYGRPRIFHLHSSPPAHNASMRSSCRMTALRRRTEC